MKHKRPILISLLCCLLFIFAGCSAQSPEIEQNETAISDDTAESIVTLDFLAHSDFAGSIEASDYYSGSAKLAAYINEYRENNPESTFVFSCGDDLVGAPISSLLKGLPVVEIMNKIGYDAMTIGNHEFDWGIDVTGETLKEANFPLLLANVYDKESGNRVDFAEPYTIIEKAGVKVGVIGLITEETPQITLATSVAPYSFRSPVDEANELVAELRSAGVDVIVALTHIPAYQQDDGTFSGEIIDFANQVEGIDVIFAGHNFDPMCIEINGVPVLQTTHNGSQLAHVSLQYDLKNKQIVKSDAELIDVLTGTLAVEPDPEIAQMVETYQLELGNVFDEVIGTATEELTIDYVAEFSIGDWWADAIRHSTGVQFAFLNSSGIFETIPAGPITIGKIYSVSPFENSLVSTSMTGEQIKELFEISYDSSRIQQMGALQISGLIVKYDLSKPDGEKVIEITLEDGTPLADDQMYSVATINFLAYGGNDYGNLAELTWQETGLLARDSFVSEMKELGEIGNSTQGRLIEIH